MPIKLPPGIRARDFSAALRQFAAVVGTQWLFTSEEDLHPYRDAYSLRWDEADEYLAAAALAPDSVEQVQQIVRIANQYRIPLYPISTGKNLTYGGSAPTYSGSVIVDLKRMNRILKVDEQRAFALVEPGVSYFDLYRYIHERNLKVWIDCPDPGWGSPLGNALDRGVGYTASPFRDHFGAHCGMEVVLPNGELMRTGMGALPGADSWQDHRYGVGPYVDGLFSQANFGIVTKMGFWLLPQPEAWLTGMVSVPRYGDLQALVADLSYLEDSQLMTGQPYYQSPLVGGAPGVPRAPNPALEKLMADGWPTPAQIEAFVAQQGGPAWRVRVQFYGPEQTLRANWAYAQARIGKHISGATFTTDELLPLPLTAAQQQTHHLSNFGIPNMAIFSMIARPENTANPADGHADFVAIVPRTAAAVHEAQRIVYETQRQLGMPTTATPFGIPVTWYHRTFLINGGGAIPTYRDNPEGNRRGRTLMAALIKNLAAAGFAQYRTSPAMQDLLAAQFSFNNHALLRFQEVLKDAADPNGVIAPGRYGIWPKHLRKRPS